MTSYVRQSTLFDYETKNKSATASDEGSENSDSISVTLPPSDDECVQRHGGLFALEMCASEDEIEEVEDSEIDEIEEFSDSVHEQDDSAEDGVLYYNADYPQYEQKLREACEIIMSTASRNPAQNIEMCGEQEVRDICAQPEATYWRQKNPLPQDDKIRFDAKTHTYTVFNEFTQQWEVCDGSATALLKAVTKKPFDANEQSKRLADAKIAFGRYANKSEQEIRHMWEFGAECGTAFHLCAEYVLNYTTELPPRVRDSPLMKTYELYLFARFVLEFVIGKYEIVRTEECMADWATTRKDTTAENRLVGDEKWYHPRDPIMQHLLPMVKLAGMADAIVHRIGAPRTVLQVWDWKRTVGVFKNSPLRPEFYRFPCDSLEDNKRNKFCVQTNTYKWFKEHTSDFIIEQMKVIIFHPEHETYMIVQVPDLQTMTQRLMRMRLKDKLKALDGKTDDESVRYSASIKEYFERAPSDPKDIWDSIKVGDKRKVEMRFPFAL